MTRDQDAPDRPSLAGDRTGSGEEPATRCDGGEDDVSVLLDRCHEELQATETRPVTRAANARIGESEAVVADLFEGAPRAVIHERIGHVRELLAGIDETGDEAAEEHVAAACRLADRVHDRTAPDDE